MPTQNLDAAVPSGVLPQTLSLAFTRERVYPMLTQQYHDGTYERNLIKDGVNNPVSISTWKLSKRLALTDITVLKSFYDGQLGPLIPFYFYDPFTEGETIGSTYDPTGDSETGRFVVKFTNPTWSHTIGLAFTDAPISFIQIA